MDNASQTEKDGQNDLALREYEQAAKLYPASSRPWVRMAQLNFEAANYGEAITAAQQAVSRDDKNNIAQSILAVSGLRVSIKALADLRQQNELTGSVQSEAQNLAKVLRESLGERVLVPTTTQPAATLAPSPSVAPPVRPVRRVAPKSAPPPPSSPSAGGSASPFGSLR